MNIKFKEKMSNFVNKIINFYLPVIFIVSLILGVGILLPYIQKAKASFSYYSTITIDHTKVPNTDQSNFPVLISSTYDGTGGEPDLRTTGNGGKVQNANGYDIGFYTNNDCTTGKMDWETESYVASTGVVVYWVKVASLSHTSDTTFYMCYGDSSISTDQSNKTGVWDSNYAAVWHLSEGDSTASGFYKDSTSNANNGTLTDVSGGTNATTFIADGALDFEGSPDFIDTADIAFGGTSPITLSGWVNADNNGGALINQGTEIALRINSSTNKAEFILNSFTTNDRAISTNTYLEGSNFYVVGTYDGTTIKIFVNGTQDGSATPTGTYADAATTFTLNGSSLIGYNDGRLDELRISTTARYGDWITTEYNNQNSPSTFYTMGSETSAGGGNPNTGTHTGIPNEKVRGGTKIRGGVKFR